MNAQAQNFIPSSGTGNPDQETPLDTILGQEALSLVEHIGLLYKQGSLGVDQFKNRFLTRSIHTVDISKVLPLLKETGYFSFNHYQLPAPTFFNPEKTSFSEYVQTCLMAIDMIPQVSRAVDLVYYAVKHVTASGENRQRRFSQTLLSQDAFTRLEDYRQRVEKTFFNNNPAHRPVNTMYDNLTSIESVFDTFNKKVKQLHARDAEVLSKQVSLLTDMLKLLQKKIMVGEIHVYPADVLATPAEQTNKKGLTQQDVEMIESTISHVNQAVTLTGLLLGRLNELTATLMGQVDAFKSVPTETV